jgi:hypothetical protein
MIAKTSLHKENVIKYLNSLSSLNVAIINELNTSEL